MILNEVISILKQSHVITILPHVNIDGDGLGSALALGLALKQLNKEVIVYIEENIPTAYGFLPGSGLLKIYPESIRQPDLVIAVDTAEATRLGKRIGVFEAAGVTVNIDHHATNSGFADYNWISMDASASGEIVYHIINEMKLDIDIRISECLYVAIATDTGGFRFSNTTPDTHLIVSDLLKRGVNISDISTKIFDAATLEKVALTGKAINSLELYKDGKVAIVTIPDDVMKSTGAMEEDCDGIVNIGRNINGVEVSAMIRQKADGEIKVNLRSKSYVDVSAIAGIYSGGGHKRAAGFTAEGDLSVVKRKLLETISKALET